MSSLPQSTDDERVVCQFCWQGSEVEDISGQLHAETSESGRLISAHHRCMQYASGLTQYKCQVFGGFDIGEVEKEIHRGNRLRCAICKQNKGKKTRGASCGCAVKSCRKSFHFTCASNDKVAVTKRLVVTKDKQKPSDKFVLYRVFCSPAHEEAFRKTLKNDLRGKTRKRKSDQVDNDDHTQDDDTMDMAVSSSNTSGDCPDGGGDTGLMSPITQLSSTRMNNTDDDEDGSDQMEDLAATKENDCSISSPTVSNTSHQVKDARKSGAAQPLLCRLTEELSNLTQPVQKGDVCSQSNGKLSPQMTEVSKSANGWLLRASDCLDHFPAHRGMETRSSNISPDLMKSPEKLTRALTDCFASLESGIVHPEQCSKRLSLKRLPKRLSSPGRRRAAKEPCPVENGHALSEEHMDSSEPASSTSSDGTSQKSPDSNSNADQLWQFSGVSDDSKQPADSTGNTESSVQEGSVSSLTTIAEDSVIPTETASPDDKECILLIPSDMEEFQRGNTQVWVTEQVCEMLQVKKDSVWVWQSVTMKSLPSQLLLFFLMDLVRESQNGNSEAVVALLFDGEYLTSRLNNYVIAQTQVFQTVSEEKAQKDIQAALLKGLEKSVENSPMMHLLHGKSQACVTVAVDVRCFKLNHLVLANLHAYKGLFWWNKDTEAATFPLSVQDHLQAVQSEALALKIWLTKVNPITEVTVLPGDDVLIDENKSVANDEFISLVQYLKDKTHTAMVLEGDGGTSVQRVIPLLAFQPVDFLMLNFREYFRKACQRFFQTRGLVTGLALVPLSNLHTGTCASISSIMKSDGVGEDVYTVSVYSAFCPAVRLTAVVLLEISRSQDLDSAVQLTDKPEDSILSPPEKKKRGRPRKEKS